MRSLRFRLVFRILLLFFHLVGIAVVGGNDHDRPGFIAGIHQPLQAQIDGFHTDDRRFIVARMPYHVAVRIINAVEVIVAGFNRFDQFVTDFRALHPRPLLKWNDVGRDFNPGFQLFIEFLRTVAIPEIRDVTEFLRFRDRVGTNAFLYQIFR